jgi:hypothetical protein
MHEMTKGFDDNMVRLCAMAVHEASDHAVIRIIPNNAAAAQILRRKEYRLLGEADLPKYGE